MTFRRDCCTAWLKALRADGIQTQARTNPPTPRPAGCGAKLFRQSSWNQCLYVRQRRAQSRQRRRIRLQHADSGRVKVNAQRESVRSARADRYAFGQSQQIDFPLHDQRDARVGWPRPRKDTRRRRPTSRDLLRSGTPVPVSRFRQERLTRAASAARSRCQAPSITAERTDTSCWRRPPAAGVQAQTAEDVRECVVDEYRELAEGRPAAHGR